MHQFVLSESVKQRVLARQGVLHPYDAFDGANTALVVVDMQNYFLQPGAPAEVPMAREIVANINRLARGVRAAGGRVVWIQTSSREGLQSWPNHHQHMLTPERRSARLKHLDDDSELFKLWPALEAPAGDLRVVKAKYSALIPSSSNLEVVLREYRLDTVLITGTATNVCCESTARDAMLLDFKVVMVSDGNATWTDQEHTASLNTFMTFFGDVLTTDETLARLAPVAMKRTA